MSTKKRFFLIICFNLLISLQLLPISIKNESGYKAFIKKQTNIYLKENPVKINRKQKTITIFIKGNYLLYSFGFYIANLKGNFILSFEDTKEYAYLTSENEQHIKISVKGIPRYL